MLPSLSVADRFLKVPPSTGTETDYGPVGKMMAKMGVYFEEHVQRRYPEFPIRRGLQNWEDYLPPLSPNLRRLLENYS